MRVHQITALITLTAFIPFALGCSTTVTRTIENNPGAATVPGDPVPIAAYTDHDGVRHTWAGTVQAAGADSLLFTRSVSGAPYWGIRSAGEIVELRRSREDVVSVDEKREDVLASGFVVWAVAISGMVLFAIIVGATRNGDSDS